MSDISLCTQFGYIKIINLNDFIELISIEPLTCNDFRYIKIKSTAINCFYSEEIGEDSDFERVTPCPNSFSSIRTLKDLAAKDLYRQVKNEGFKESLDMVLLDFVQYMGDLNYLVKLPNGFVMPADSGDFRIKTFNNKYVLCNFFESRFKCYKFDIDKYLEELRKETVA
jgi:hypothetical protein